MYKWPIGISKIINTINHKSKADIKNLVISSADSDAEQLRVSDIAGGSVKLY